MSWLEFKISPKFSQIFIVCDDDNKHLSNEKVNDVEKCLEV